MKPPTIDELRRIRNRFDEDRIDHGEEMADPLGLGKTYVVGGDYVQAEELVRRLVRRCLELESFVQGEVTKP